MNWSNWSDSNDFPHSVASGDLLSR